MPFMPLVPPRATPIRYAKSIFGQGIKDLRFVLNERCIIWASYKLKAIMTNLLPKSEVFPVKSLSYRTCYGCLPNSRRSGETEDFTWKDKLTEISLNFRGLNSP